MSEVQRDRWLRNLCLLATWVCAFWMHPPLYAQSEKVIILENADSLVGKEIDGERARELIGHVRFTQENVRVSCDRALQFLSSGNVVLTGNVVVEDDSVVMKAPRGLYFRRERKAEAFDSVSLDDGTVHLTARYGEYFVEPKRAFFRSHVVLHDTGSVLKADSLTYFRVEEHTIAQGNVSIYSYADHVTIRGHHFENFNRERFSRMTAQPVLVQFDTSSAGRVDTLVVRSQVMESYRDSLRRLLAIDSVEIVRSELAATAGLAAFFTEGDSMHLRKSPVVWYQRTQVTGDSINIYLEERKLHLVRVLGDAFAVSQSDSLRPLRFDQVTGEDMWLHFENQTISKIRVDTHAISVYHLYEDTTANGLNKTSGDKLLLLWEEGKLSSIRVYGGVEGQYFPENMVKGHEMEYALPGFLWREHRPRILRSDFGRQEEVALN